MRTAILVAIVLFIAQPFYALAGYNNIPSGHSIAPEVNLGNDTIICASASLVLNAGNTGADYLWSTGETTQKITVSTSGNYSVTVTQNGETATDDIYVEVAPVFQAEFYSYQLTSCLPALFQFSDASQWCGSPIVEWNWQFGDGSGSTEQEPLHFYTINGDFTVTLTVKNSQGQVLTVSKEVSVHEPTPIVNLGNDTAFCEGGSLTLDAGNSGATFFWSTGESTQKIAVNKSGSYWVQVSNGFCSGIDTLHVIVTPKLYSNFSWEQKGRCTPLPVAFKDASLSCAVSIKKWQWEFGDGSSSDLQSPTHPYSHSGKYIVKLTVTDNLGAVHASQQEIEVSDNAPIVSLGNDTTICLGTKILLDAGVKDAVYKWSTGETTQTIWASIAGNYSVIVQKDGCTGKDTVDVNTNVPAKANFGFDITSKCLPVAVKFTDSSKAICDVSFSKWFWEFGDGTTASSQNPVHIYTTAGTFTVKLTIKTNTNVSISETKQVVISTTPPVQSAFPDQTICRGSSIQLNAGNPGATFAWTPSNTLNNVSIQEPVASPKTTTKYVVSISKCGVTIKDTIIVYIDSASKPGITQQNITLTSTVGTSYQWYKDGAAINGAVARNYNPSGIGYYQVEVSNQRGCKNISDKHFYMPGGGDAEKIKVKLSPNPTRGMTYVLLSRVPEKPVTMTVMDRFTKKLFTRTIQNNVNPVDLTKYSCGLYFVELVFADNRRIVMPLLVTR